MRKRTEFAFGAVALGVATVCVVARVITVGEYLSVLIGLGGYLLGRLNGKSERKTLQDIVRRIRE